jgi:hypothetical protein
MAVFSHRMTLLCPKISNKMNNSHTYIPQYNYTITKYNAINQPKVKGIIPVEEALQIIKYGDSKTLPLINEAREYGKGSTEYDTIKKYKLPTVRFNFLLEDSASNTNITAPTGLIYLDADDTDTIPESEYVYAKWRSLSNTGYGVLVKTGNLTKTNYEDTYNELSEVIGIKSDSGARKLIQQTVLSYDSNLYYNPDSLIYSYIEKEEIKEEIKKVSFSNIIKEKISISSNEPFFKNEDNAVYRDDNIDEYFKGEFADVPFRVFSDEKTKICQPFIPFKTIIKEGQRNNSMLSFLTMHASLNLNCNREYLLEMSNHMNYKMHPKLPKYEVNSIIRNVLKKRDEGSLEMYCNKERRILFNPKIKFARVEKRKITAREIGNIRRNKTEIKIYQTIENWDFEANGKITRVKVAKISEKSLTTIKRYWSEFKDYVKDLNTSNKHDFKLPDKSSR